MAFETLGVLVRTSRMPGKKARLPRKTLALGWPGPVQAHWAPIKIRAGLAQIQKSQRSYRSVYGNFFFYKKNRELY